MGMQMWDHVAEYVVVQFVCPEHALQHTRRQRQIAKVSRSFFLGKLKGLDHVAAADQHTVSLDKLILREIKATGCQVADLDKVFILLLVQADEIAYRAAF